MSLLATLARFIKVEHTIFSLPLIFAGAYLGAGRKIPALATLAWLVLAVHIRRPSVLRAGSSKPAPPPGDPFPSGKRLHGTTFGVEKQRHHQKQAPPPLSHSPPPK